MVHSLNSFYFEEPFLLTFTFGIHVDQHKEILCYRLVDTLFLLFLSQSLTLNLLNIDMKKAKNLYSGTIKVFGCLCVRFGLVFQ